MSRFHSTITDAKAVSPNAAYTAYQAARAAAVASGALPPPRHIVNAPTALMKELGHGAGYVYDHDAEDGFSGQDYFPEGMARPALYAPTDRGFERDLAARRARLDALRQRRAAGQAR